MKAILFLLLIILISSFASAVPSTDRTDYYYNGSYYLTDGIESTDLAFNGSPAVNAEEPCSYGLIPSGASCNIAYDNTRASLGSLSMKVFDGENNRLDIYNDTFSGSMGMRTYITTNTVYMLPTVFDKDNKEIIMAVYNAVSATHYHYNDEGAGNFVCDKNSIPIVLNAWVDFKFVWEDGYILGYINNTLCHNFTGKSGFDYTMPFRSGNSPDFWMDEFYISNENTRPEAGGVIPGTTTIDLLFKNSTSSYKTTFGEGENFYSFINWTDDSDDSPINSTLGTCNVSFKNGLIEYPSPAKTFNVCSSGCNYTYKSQTFSGLETDGSVFDYVYFKGCHQQTSAGNLILNISCASGKASKTVTPSQIPLCSNTISRILFNTTVCKNDASVTIGVYANVPNSQRKLVTDFALDREFLNQKDEGGDVIFYNQSKKLWYINHSHEYYTHGTKIINASCSYYSDSLLDKKVSESITIVNAPPQLNIRSATVGSVVYNFSKSIFDVFEYINGSWSFSSLILDDDLLKVNFTIKNKNKVILATGSTSPLTVSSSLFRDEENMPYNISITANDTFGARTSVYELFNITDLSIPSCSGLGNRSILNNSVLNWAVSCSDESFFSFNISCDNGHSYGVEGLDVTAFSYSGNTAIVGDTICNYVYCDGHTDDFISLSVASTEDGREKRFDNFISLSTEHYDLSDFTTIKLSDRESFRLKFDVPTDYIVFTVQSDEYIHIMGNKKYMGWLVSGDYWVDFVNPLVMKIVVGRTSDNEVEVQITLSKKVTDITFESIGKKNCISGSQYITATQPDEEFRFLIPNTCKNESILELLMYAFTFLIIMSLWIVFRIFIKIPFMNIMIDLGLAFFGMSFFGCDWVIGLLITVIAFVMFFIDMSTA